MATFMVTKLNDQSTAFKNSIFLNPMYSDLQYITINDNKSIYRVKYTGDLGDYKVGFNLAARQFLTLNENDSIKITKFSKDMLKKPDEKIQLIVDFISKSRNDVVIDEMIVEDIRLNLMDVPIYCNHKYFYQYNSTQFLFYLNTPIDYAMIGNDTEIELITTNSKIQIKSSNIFKGNFNFQEMGIGGLGKQFEIIFRRAFASRLIPEKIAKDLGVNHIRGILLYGPPGCGKTLVARQMGKVLNCAEPKIVNGPSLLSKFVGESEENVRKLFADAMADKSNTIHLIICDEFDALVKKRGMGNDNTGTNDKIVNQFLTMIDGPEPLNNILLICMTNRKDLIDEAILRPGRLELQIEIGLPDEDGRKEILSIHTSKMHEKGYMADDVDINMLATKCKNFTGAELESIVKTSVSYALAREMDPSNLSNIKNIQPIVTKSDFEKSIMEIKPQFGSVSSIVETLCSTPFSLYSEMYEDTYNDILYRISHLKNGNKQSFLLVGPHYCGKTVMAAQLAKQSNYNCIKFINAESLMNSMMKEMALNDIVDMGMKSDSCIIILDSIEKIIEYSKLGNLYNNKILQTIYIILDRVIQNNKLTIIMTSYNLELCETLDLTNLVDMTYSLDYHEMIEEFKNRKFE
jgi:vesicle-fusing ATPase